MYHKVQYFWFKETFIWLTEEECSALSTTDNYNYKCDFNSGKNNCKEVVQSEWEKENFNYRSLNQGIILFLFLIPSQ